MGVIENRRRIIAAQPHLVTASGETLGVAIAEPKLKKLAVTFGPVQSGSGTPSPSNVRPISGWSTIGVRLGVGKNLWDEQYTDIDTTGNAVQYRSVYVGAEMVTFSTTCPANASGYAVLYALPGAVSTGADSGRNGFRNGSPRVITPENGYVTIAYRASTGGADPRNYTTQIEYGSSATAYEPHTGTTVLTALGGTYYGGTVDLVSGVMTVNRAYVLFDGSSDEAWNQESLSVAGTNFYINIPSASGFSYDVLCNMADKRTSGGNYQQGTCYISAAKNFNIAIGDLISVTTASAFKTWLSTHNVQLVYQIASQTVTLTPQTIAAMRGQQTVTFPAGAVEISYWTH